MESTQKISDAGLYTDFSGLQKLRAKVSGNEKTEESLEANREVAKQFESLFLQMMLKSMRDATAAGDSTESDQTRFYQEMFDKQIALDLADSSKGGGLGIAAMLEKDMGGSQQNRFDEQSAVNNFELIRNQVNRANALVQAQQSSEQE